MVEQDPSTENNIALSQTTTEYIRSYTQAVRSNWIKKTEHVNLNQIKTDYGNLLEQ